MPEDTVSHQAFGGMLIWTEADARRLVEDAGFIDVSVIYVPMSGDGRLDRALDRLVKTEDMRIVRGSKPGWIA